MGLGAPWEESYIQHQYKEYSSVSFIYKDPVTHQNVPWINPIVLGEP